MPDLRFQTEDFPGGVSGYALVPWQRVRTDVSMSLPMGVLTSITASFATEVAGADVMGGTMDALTLKTNIANAFSLSGVRFTQGGSDHVVKAGGQVQRDISPVTGNGTQVGTLTAGQGEVVLSDWTSGTAPEITNFRGVAGAPVNGPDSPFATYAVTFRVPTAPVRAGSLSVLGKMRDGTTFNYLADSNGFINQPRVKGRVNYATGVVTLVGVTPTNAGTQAKVPLAFLGIPGVVEEYIDLIDQESLRYNAIAYTYLPMEAALLGINPVRLPSDGRVPIYRKGGIVVVGNKRRTAAVAVSNGQVVNVGRTRLSRMAVIGANGVQIFTGWTANLEAGTVTFQNVAGYSQPVQIEHRIEDMSMLHDVQIDGTLTMLRPLSHAYAAGESYVSSALMTQDLKARTSLVFDQESWDKVTFSDSLEGAAAGASFNVADNPIVVTNAGALTERWALHFQTNTSFVVIGESVGQIAIGNTGEDCAPINTRTGEALFVLPAAGLGAGWNPGNLIRFNTVGAQAPLWMVRTVQQGPEAGVDYTFELLARGDIDNPL